MVIFKRILHIPAWLDARFTSVKLQQSCRLCKFRIHARILTSHEVSQYILDSYCDHSLIVLCLKNSRSLITPIFESH